MISEVEIYQIDAFTKETFSGNPAGVTFVNGLSEKQKQSIAREMNLSETAFISESKNADYKLQWFTPTKEVDLCGHATIASLHFLYEKNIIKENQFINFETLSGIIKCYTKDRRYFMQIPTPDLQIFSGCTEEILEALNTNRTNVCNSPFILLNNGYLFIQVDSVKSLWEISPDFKALKGLSDSKKEFFDIAVFTIETIDNNSSAQVRFFAPFHGINEDPVTGSACGPLLLVLKKLSLLTNYSNNEIIYFEQGDILNRKGRVGVQFNEVNNELFISGNAVTVLKGKLYL